jgi:hypothetical protein
MRTALHRQADAEGEGDWTLHPVAGSVIGAQWHAVGARTGGAVGPRAGRQKLWAAAQAASVPGSTRVRKARASRMTDRDLQCRQDYSR